MSVPKKFNVYKFDDYRDFIEEYCEHKKKSDPRFSYSVLAKATRLQPSYLSNVMRKKASLNSDQLYAICHEAALSSDSREFLLTLLELERTKLASRKAELLRQVGELRSHRLRSEEFLGERIDIGSEQKAKLYYSNALCSILHMFLAIPKYNRDLSKICQKLGVSADALEEALQILTFADVIKREGGKIVLCKPNLHLAKENPLSQMHALLLRLRSIEYQNLNGKRDNLFFTSTFSANKKTFGALKTRIMALIEDAGALVEAAPSEEVFQLNIDLFEY